ncbi:MAG: DUF2344 domain-containing protein, partial [Deltaproteobacteria bacterium]|nr:DUF2344 domain-containing protein [Deltaproteobacteria bacterium]
LDAPLPWDVVDIGVRRDFLVAEWHRAEGEASTGDCRTGACEGCGLCDFQAVMPRVAGPRDLPPCAPPPAGDAPGAEAVEPPTTRIRFRYAKTGAASLLSHLETVTAIHRGLKAAGVKIAYSHGFHPHPKFTLGPALPLGTETLVDVGELRVEEVPPLAATQDLVNARLPEGLRLEALWVLPSESRALSGGGTREDYRVTPSPEAAAAAEALGGWEPLVEAFWSSPSFPVTKHRKGKPDRVLEAKEFADAVWVDGGTVVLQLRRRLDGTALGPEELLRTLAGLPPGVRAADRILKTRSEIL